VVAGVAPGGPAEQAGVKTGDVVAEVAGTKPQSLAELYRRVWALGPAGVDVPLTVTRKNAVAHLTLHTIDRNTLLKKPHLH
jgi:S1-C subfamily serine protease